jgi:UDPglucose 6-dehydrogenase
VVIGVEDPRASDVMTELYGPFTRTGAPILQMDCASAEMSKYAANAILATRISFMNEVANVCEACGGDVDLVRRAVGADSRIGSSFLFSGIGYGGSCFPKDVSALVRFAASEGYQFEILKAVEQVNRQQRLRFVERMERHLRPIKGRTIAVWGLAFKPRTDDMREAPAITIINRLLGLGAKVQAYDPQAARVARGILGTRVHLVDGAYEALKGADALAILTEWNEFREPDFDRMRKLMRTPIIFDGRNVYKPAQMKAQGFTYVSVGRPDVSPREKVVP